MKEITGHVSDTVHKYQTTSDEQRMVVSEIIQGHEPQRKLSEAPCMEIVELPEEVSVEEKFRLEPLKLPSVSNVSENTSESESKSNEDVGEIIQNAIKAVSTRKAKLKIEVELMD